MSGLLERYRQHYRIPDSVALDLTHLRLHLVVEFEVTEALLASTPESRRSVFEEGYRRIYEELWWFNVAEVAAPQPVPDVAGWCAMIGPPCRVYEVGSGQGRLAHALADRGYDVTATDITSARGDGRAARRGVVWGETDGVHLERFAEAGTFDAVISDQVVEHLHPDDFVCHLRSARALLRPRGRYVFKTPHGPTGPYDSSLAFGFSEALGTHLREYSFTERVDALRTAGFGVVLAEKPSRAGTTASATYARYLVAAERVLARLSPPARRVVVKRLLRDGLLFRRNAILAAVRA